MCAPIKRDWPTSRWLDVVGVALLGMTCVFEGWLAFKIVSIFDVGQHVHHPFADHWREIHVLSRAEVGPGLVSVVIDQEGLLANWRGHKSQHKFVAAHLEGMSDGWSLGVEIISTSDVNQRVPVEHCSTAGQRQGPFRTRGLTKRLKGSDDSDGEIPTRSSRRIVHYVQVAVFNASQDGPEGIQERDWRSKKTQTDTPTPKVLLRIWSIDTVVSS
ncbi:hypothetical protein C8R44DRAFT_748592 [Mycena epipterygia]|nr:hypothetical protein C8R44DRAFT_748592 [Mycena epipterygia]